jgi:hypothetical protein
VLLDVMCWCAFNVSVVMASLAFPCLVALPTDRNDSHLKWGLCLSVVSTPRHGNTFEFMFWCMFWCLFWFMLFWCIFCSL